MLPVPRALATRPGRARRRRPTRPPPHQTAFNLAERRGFEPLVPLRVHMISNGVPPTTPADSRVFLGSLDDVGSPSEAPPPPSPPPWAGGLGDPAIQVKLAEAGVGDTRGEPTVIASGTSSEAIDEGAAGTRPADATPRAGDPVELALSFALEEAAKAGRFDVVVQLARDLEARRLAGAPHVVPPNVVPIGRPKRG